VEPARQRRGARDERRSWQVGLRFGVLTRAKRGEHAGRAGADMRGRDVREREEGRRAGWERGRGAGLLGWCGRARRLG
jgi:hypothetical protein